MTHQQLAKLCLQAYTDAMPDGTVYPIFTGLKHGPAVFVTQGDPCNVVFRGTCDAEGWVEDLRAGKVKADDKDIPGLIHGGFGYCFANLQERLLEAVGKRACRVTGHSLGGAMASLAAFKLKAQCIEVVTFGAPRVGDAVFARALSALSIPHMRYVNQFDPVPWVPAFLWGFRHSHPARWFDGAVWGPFSPAVAVMTGAVHAYRAVTDLVGCVNTIKHLRDYHQMESYVEALS